MKQSLIFKLFHVFIVALNDSDSKKDVDWLTDYNPAIKLSQKENKNALAYFTGTGGVRPVKC